MRAFHAFVCDLCWTTGWWWRFVICTVYTASIKQLRQSGFLLSTSAFRAPTAERVRKKSNPAVDNAIFSFRGGAQRALPQKHQPRGIAEAAFFDDSHAPSVKQNRFPVAFPAGQ